MYASELELSAYEIAKSNALANFSDGQLKVIDVDLNSYFDVSDFRATNSFVFILESVKT